MIYNQHNMSLKYIYIYMCTRLLVRTPEMRRSQKIKINYENIYTHRNLFLSFRFLFFFFLYIFILLFRLKI